MQCRCPTIAVVSSIPSGAQKKPNDGGDTIDMDSDTTIDLKDLNYERNALTKKTTPNKTKAERTTETSPKKTREANEEDKSPAKEQDKLRNTKKDLRRLKEHITCPNPDCQQIGTLVNNGSGGAVPMAK